MVPVRVTVATCVGDVPRKERSESERSEGRRAAS
jgi:hypothetical protein